MHDRKPRRSRGALRTNLAGMGPLKPAVYLRPAPLNRGQGAGCTPGRSTSHQPTMPPPNVEKAGAVRFRIRFRPQAQVGAPKGGMPNTQGSVLADILRGLGWCVCARQCAQEYAWSQGPSHVRQHLHLCGASQIGGFASHPQSHRRAAREHATAGAVKQNVDPGSTGPGLDHLDELLSSLL